MRNKKKKKSSTRVRRTRSVAELAILVVLREPHAKRNEHRNGQHRRKRTASRRVRRIAVRAAHWRPHFFRVLSVAGCAAAHVS